MATLQRPPSHDSYPARRIVNLTFRVEQQTKMTGHQNELPKSCDSSKVLLVFDELSFSNGLSENAVPDMQLKIIQSSLENSYNF